MYAIIGAMEKEIASLKAKMIITSSETSGNIEFILGTFHSHQVVLVQSGIGKVMAALVTVKLIERFHPEAIINIGTAGGVDLKLKPLDIVLAEKVSYHDVDVRGFSSNYRYGQVPGGFPAYFSADPTLLRNFLSLEKSIKDTLYVGTMLSGDSFMTKRALLDELVSNFFQDHHVLAVDMESGAIAQVCYVYHTPWIVIRSISDNVGQTNQQLTFEEYVEQSSARVAKLLDTFFHQL